MAHPIGDGAKYAARVLSDEAARRPLLIEPEDKGETFVLGCPQLILGPDDSHQSGLDRANDADAARQTEGAGLVGRRWFP